MITAGSHLFAGHNKWYMDRKFGWLTSLCVFTFCVFRFINPECPTINLTMRAKPAFLPSALLQGKCFLNNFWNISFTNSHQNVYLGKNSQLLRTESWRSSYLQRRKQKKEPKTLRYFLNFLSSSQNPSSSKLT